MVRYCIVKGCQSGRPLDLRERKKKGLRLATLFSVPKCPKLRKLWINALILKDLDEKDIVCERHFSDADIRKGNSYTIKGQRVFVENRRWHLRNGAVPVTRQGHQPMDCSQTKQETEVDTPTQYPQMAPQLVEVGRTEKQQMCQENTEESRLEQFFLQLVDPEEEQIEIIEEPIKVKEEQFQLKVLLMQCNENRSNGALLKDISSQLASIIPERWCYHIRKDLQDILLIHLDANSLLEKICLRVTKDLSIMICRRNQSEILLCDSIHSIEEIYYYMRIAEITQICSGTGFENYRYANQCSGIIKEDEQYKLRLPNPRCKSCRIVRNRIQTDVRHEKKRQVD